MLTQLRSRYPHASLKSELVTIDHGKYIVRALVEVDGVVLATGLAAADTVETAEDKARNRAIAILDLEGAGDLEVKAASDVFQEDQEPLRRNAEPVLEEKIKPKIPTTIIPPTKNNLPSREQKQKKENVELPETDNSRQLFSLSEPEPTEINGSSAPLPLENSGVESLEEKNPPSTATIPELDLTPVTYSAPDYDEEEPDYSAHSPAELATGVNSNEDATAVDFSEIIAKTDWEMKRLGWNTEQGKNYLLETYGKRSRHYLGDEELLEFLDYLQSQPNQ